MLLSAAIIVRDEAEHLEACLTSLDGLVDEIVVVDTGSTDASVDVARRHGAIVGHEPWQGDFATPRNQSLDLASGEWILYIDADERIRPGDDEQRRRQIAAATDHAAFRIHFVPIVGWTPYVEYRLWRHKPDVRFTGRIHESIVPSIQTAARRDGQRVTVSDVLTIDHLGYEGDQRHKHTRNEPILLAALEEHPDRVFYYDHLARIYDDLGRDDEAVAMWMRGIEMARARSAPHHDDRLLWIDRIVYALARDRIDDGLTSLVAEALERFPDVPALELAAARLEFASGEYERSARRVEWITSLSIDDVIATGSSYDERVLGEWAWNVLGLCRFALGAYDGAAEAFACAERAAPQVPDYGVRRRLAEARAAGRSG